MSHWDYLVVKNNVHFRGRYSLPFDTYLCRCDGYMVMMKGSDCKSTMTSMNKLWGRVAHPSLRTPTIRHMAAIMAMDMDRGEGGYPEENLGKNHIEWGP